MKKTVSTSAVAAIAAGAAVSVGANAALAADPVAAADPQYYLSLEGSAIFADPASDKLGDLVSGPGGTVNHDSFDTDIGYRGAAAFGQSFDDNWDWRVGVAYSNFMKNRASVTATSSGGSGGSFFGSQTTDLSYLTGDLELGYNVKPSDNFDLRLFAGLRALNSKSSEDKFGAASSGGPLLGSVDQKVDSEFLGIGPRAGLDFSTRMGDSILGLSGMAAGSILFGKLDQDVAVDVSSIGLGSFSIHDGNSSNQTVYNLEAALGADFHITDSSVLTIGYRGEYWDSLRYSQDKNGNGDDMLTHGPFVRFVAKF